MSFRCGYGNYSALYKHEVAEGSVYVYFVLSFGKAVDIKIGIIPALYVQTAAANTRGAVCRVPRHL